MTTEQADHADKQTERVRQGTGPRQTVTVLFVSLMLASASGVALLIYYLVG